MRKKNASRSKATHNKAAHKPSYKSRGAQSTKAPFASGDFWRNLKNGLMGRCPRCGLGSVYQTSFFSSLTFKKTCDHCHLALADNDNGDGPAVFLIFILGFLLVPLALWVDHVFTPPVWLHALLWGVGGVAMTLGLLRPTKSYVLTLIYFHRPDMWHHDN